MEKQYQISDFYQITFYVPVTHLEQVKNAMFEKGAGTLGNYKCCAWQVLGEGQFKPTNDSRPYIGKLDQLEKVKEYKVEMLCDHQCLDVSIDALKSSHPYEVPAFFVTKFTN